MAKGRNFINHSLPARLKTDCFRNPAHVGGAKQTVPASTPYKGMPHISAEHTSGWAKTWNSRKNATYGHM